MSGDHRTGEAAGNIIVIPSFLGSLYRYRTPKIRSNAIVRRATSPTHNDHLDKRIVRIRMEQHHRLRTSCGFAINLAQKSPI